MVVAFVDVSQAVVQYCAWARVANDVGVATLKLDGAASQAFNACQRRQVHTSFAFLQGVVCFIFISSGLREGLFPSFIFSDDCMNDKTS